MEANKAAIKFQPATLKKVCDHLQQRGTLSYFVQDKVLYLEGTDAQEFIELGIFIGKLQSNGAVRNTG